MKVCILEPQDYSPESIAIYKTLGEVSLNFADRATADIIVIRLAHKLTKDFLAECKDLKIIACPTTGLDHIDLAECERRGIKVVSLKGETAFLGTITATAELACGLILALIRNIPAAHHDVVSLKHWNRDLWKGYELKDKKLGILGFGRLGKIMAGFGLAFNMEVLAHDPHVDFAEMEAAGVIPVALDELLRVSDVLSVHIPLNKETVNFIGQEEFGKMKPTAYIVNTSRGEVIDEAALLDALKNGRIAGAGLDVMTSEHANGEFLKNNPLIAYAEQHANLLLTPHIGGATYDSMIKTEIFIANKVALTVRDQ